MEYIIGRNQNTRQLTVIKDGVERNYGQANSVPMDVSRHHISLQPEGNGKWKIKNLNEKNVTFVNGIAVESKTISEKDKVELGNSHYLFSWAALSEPKVEAIDISSLEKIWDWYETTQLEMKESERRIQNNQKLASILSSCGILFVFVEGLGFLRFVLMGLSILITIYFWYRGNNSDSSLNIRLNDLSKEFRKKYTCPKCGHFMGNTPYDVLIQNDGCFNCKTKFKK
jgi:hypothetical protein